MRWGLVLASVIVLAGCGIAAQPESAQTVAAFEIPLPTAEERTEFLGLLIMVAQAEGLHVDAATREELAHSAQASPLLEQTLHATVWRGTNDDELVASVSDSHAHLGQAWITFFRGENPVLASQFRERAMVAIRRRWPEILLLPIMPTGAIPLSRDLIRTPTGYVVNPEAASMYGLRDDNTP